MALLRGVNEDPLPDGEVDIFEWYGNGAGQREPRSMPHRTGRHWKRKNIPDGRRRLAHLANALGRRRIQILADYAAAQTVLQCAAQTHCRAWQSHRQAVAVQQSRLLGMSPMFTLAVGGVVAGDPARVPTLADAHRLVRIW